MQHVASTAAILEADESKAETGDAGPHPPAAVRLRQVAQEWQQREDGYAPANGADGHGAHAIDVHRLNFGDFECLLAEFEFGNFWPAEFVATHGAFETFALAIANLALDGFRPIGVADRRVFAFTHAAHITVCKSREWALHTGLAS